MDPGVLGYGIGPMFLSPLSEIPQLGRTPVYIACLTVFVAPGSDCPQ